MIRHPIVRRASPAWRSWLAVVVALLALFAAPAPGTAQEQPDTVRRDTAVVPIPPEEVTGDTIPVDTLAAIMADDTLGPAPHIPVFPQPFPEGYAYARWEWDRDELLRFHGLSLLELLEQIPGLLVTRAGGFGRPAGLSFLGAGGGRVRVFRDGLEVDPLGGAAPDLQQIGLVDLSSVRVQRALTEIRIELSSFRIADRRPFSQVEAGTGTPEARFLRALFSRTVGPRSVVTGAYDLTSTEGFGYREPFSFNNGRLRWSYALSERTGVEAEYRLAGVQRESSLEGFSENFDRHEMVLRGRSELLPGLTVDGLLARMQRVPGDDGEASGGAGSGGGATAADRFGLRLSGTQAALRAGYLRDFGYLEGVARVRGGDAAGTALPATELSARGVLSPLPWSSIEAEARIASVDEGAATELSATGRVGPFGGLSLFASVSAGERWVPVVRDTFDVRADTTDVGGVPQVTETTTFRPDYSSVRAAAGGLRLGAEWTRWGAVLGGALLSGAASTAAPFGTAFDLGVPPQEVEAAAGVEAYGVLPAPFWDGALRLEGWYTNWSEIGFRPYLPSQQGRLALVFHTIRYEGQLEPTIRLEAVRRGSALVASPDRSGFGSTTQPYNLLNFYLQLRILDVRAFFAMENLLNNRLAADVADERLRLPGPRILYGIRWHFMN